MYLPLFSPRWLVPDIYVPGMNALIIPKIEEKEASFGLDDEVEGIVFALKFAP